MSYYATVIVPTDNTEPRTLVPRRAFERLSDIRRWALYNRESWRDALEPHEERFGVAVVDDEGEPVLMIDFDRTWGADGVELRRGSLKAMKAMKAVQVVRQWPPPLTGGDTEPVPGTHIETVFGDGPPGTPIAVIVGAVDGVPSFASLDDALKAMNGAGGHQ